MGSNRRNFVIPDDIANGAIKEYESGVSGHKIAQKLGVSHSFVYHWLRRQGVSTRTNSEANEIGSTIYKATNHNAFSAVTEESLYWAGFLMADGCIYQHPKRGNPTISLNLKDLDHIQKFNKFVNSERKISRNKDGTYHLSIPSKRMTADLAEMGVVPRKTFIAQVPPDRDEIVSSRHFWRGCVDGDGYIGIARSGKTDRQSGAFAFISASRPLLEQFNTFLVENEVHPRSIHRNDQSNVFSVTAKGCPAKEIVALLYKGSSVFLHRKREIVSRIIGE